MRPENYTYLWVGGQVFRMSLGITWFNSSVCRTSMASLDPGVDSMSCARPDFSPTEWVGSQAQLDIFVYCQGVSAAVARLGTSCHAGHCCGSWASAGQDYWLLPPPWKLA